MAGENEFSANTLIESAKANQNFDGAYTGDFDETENSLRTYRDESVFDHIVSGGVITDPGASLTQITTAIVALIDGRRVTIGATSKTYTASKDTYVDVLRSGATASYVYTEVSNNAASPALAANSIRIAIVTTNGTEITNSNQGQENQVIPIASSVPYSVTDSLGNLIAPRDSMRRVLGYRQRVSTFTTTNTSPTQITELSCPVIVPTGRKVKITLKAGSRILNSAASNESLIQIWEGVVGSGTQLSMDRFEQHATAGEGTSITSQAVRTPTSASITYNGSLHTSAAGTVEITAASTSPAFILVELV